MSKRAIVIGAGLTGMTVAIQLARKDFKVEIFEKNEGPGGRIRNIFIEGFTFNPGPNLISYPEIVNTQLAEFRKFHKNSFTLEKLDPTFRIYAGESETFDLRSESNYLNNFFSRYDKKGKQKLTEYLNRAKIWYNHLEDSVVRMQEFKENRGLKKLFTEDHESYIRSLFTDYHLLSLLEFPVSYNGLLPEASSMLHFAGNYSCLTQGLYFPMQGMTGLTDYLLEVLGNLNVNINYSSPVDSFDIIDNKVAGIITNGKDFHADYFIAATDYHHAEHLVPAEYRNFPEKQWEKAGRTHTNLLFCIGIDKKLSRLAANSVYFDNPAGIRIGKSSRYSDKLGIRAVYIFCPSKLRNCAPQGMETLILRVIIAPGIEDSGKIRELFLEKAINILELISGEDIHDHILVKKTLAQTDFSVDFNTYRGKVFGFLNDIYPYGFKRLPLRNKHLVNIFYAENAFFTGYGIPSALITGKCIADEIFSDHMKYHQ